MLARTCLLVVSNPKHVSRILSTVQEKVNGTLYIQLLSEINGEPLSFHSNLFPSWAHYSKIVLDIYSQVATHCQDLDVRVLLSALKYKNISELHTHKQIDLVILDKIYNQSHADEFLRSRIKNIAKEYSVVTLNNNAFVELSANYEDNHKTYQHTVVRGTFDRLHLAHKVLLSEAALRSSNKVTVGVTKENMLQSKTLWELIEPVEMRINAVRNFLTDICPELEISLVPITNTFGPTQDDASMDLLVVSMETFHGGQKINAVRTSKNLPLLDVLPVELVSEPYRNLSEDRKISSSTVRKRLLGTLLKPATQKKFVLNKPFVIGLTGGIASGKSGIAQRLRELGADVIDCDKVAHKLYQPGKPCYNLIVKAFGKSILSSNGRIDRKALSSNVFKNSDELNKLNSLIWPAVTEEVSKRIKQSHSPIIVVEAAVLLVAGRDKLCHEVWTTVVPEVEAIKRLQTRNGLTEEEAQRRLGCQCNNRTYIEAANVVFCSLWSTDYTRSQVDKAWNLLLNRLQIEKLNKGNPKTIL